MESANISPLSVIFEVLALLALDQMLTYYAHLLMFFLSSVFGCLFRLKGSVREKAAGSRTQGCQKDQKAVGNPTSEWRQ